MAMAVAIMQVQLCHSLCYEFSLNEIEKTVYLSIIIPHVGPRRFLHRPVPSRHLAPFFIHSTGFHQVFRAWWLRTGFQIRSGLVGVHIAMFGRDLRSLGQGQVRTQGFLCFTGIYRSKCDRLNLRCVCLQSKCSFCFAKSRFFFQS